MGAAEARTVVGILGNIISGFLFLSPLPTFLEIWREKSVQSYKPHPYVMTFLNCLLWCFYGMPVVHPDSLLVITINAAGLIIQGSYIGVFLMYSDAKKRRNILLAMVGEVIFMVILIIITMTCLHNTTDRSALVGIVCIIGNILMYVSPLSIMKRVIKTKSVRYMVFYLSLAQFLNGIVWSLYALLKFDPYILVPNGLGTISATVQLTLYAMYYKTTKWDDGLSSNQSSVELQP